MCGGEDTNNQRAKVSGEKDDDHIAQIMELMGEIPRSVAFAEKYSGESFNRKGELRHITKLRYWPLESVLHDKYLFPPGEADALTGFLAPMLRLHPEKHAQARKMVGHWWLEGVVVQGEVDVLRREVAGAGGGVGPGVQAGVPEVVRKLGSGGGAGDRDRDLVPTKEDGEMAEALTQSEADAMKPVDESGFASAGPSVPASPTRHGQGQGQGQGQGGGQGGGRGTLKLGAAPAGSGPRGGGGGAGARR